MTTNISILVTHDGKKYHAMVVSLTDRKQPPQKFSVYEKDDLYKGLTERIAYFMMIETERQK